MGSACCVAARNPTLPNRSRNGESHRQARYSPSWSFRWDNYRRVAGEIENPSCQSGERTNIDVRLELKDGIGSERGIISDGGSPLHNLGTPISQKSPSYEGVSTNYMSPSGNSFQYLLSFVVCHNSTITYCDSIIFRQLFFSF